MRNVKYAAGLRMSEGLGWEGRRGGGGADAKKTSQPNQLIGPEANKQATQMQWVRIFARAAALIRRPLLFFSDSHFCHSHGEFTPYIFIPLQKGAVGVGRLKTIEVAMQIAASRNKQTGRYRETEREREA